MEWNTMEMDKQVVAAIITALTAVGLMSVSTSARADDVPAMEKCYGIVKAGQNDCDSNDLSCSMKAVIDSDPNYWIYLPKGACAKIVGGITKPAASATSTGAMPATTTTTTMPSTTTTPSTNTTTTTTTTVPSTAAPGTNMDPNVRPQ